MLLIIAGEQRHNIALQRCAHPSKLYRCIVDTLGACTSSPRASLTIGSEHQLTKKSKAATHVRAGIPGELVVSTPEAVYLTSQLSWSETHTTAGHGVRGSSNSFKIKTEGTPSPCMQSPRMHLYQSHRICFSDQCSLMQARRLRAPCVRRPCCNRQGPTRQCQEVARQQAGRCWRSGFPDHHRLPGVLHRGAQDQRRQLPPAQQPAAAAHAAHRRAAAARQRGRRRPARLYLHTSVQSSKQLLPPAAAAPVSSSTWSSFIFACASTPPRLATVPFNLSLTMISLSLGGLYLKLTDCCPQQSPMSAHIATCCCASNKVV